MSNSGKKPTDDDEVEQLLRAAQDDMLLKLNINSHMSRAAAINPDLDRRFQALKKPTKVDDKVPIKIDNDDLLSRFAALKNSIPSHSRSEKKGDESINLPVTEEDDEDEVEKVIKWAIDAARLDPSPPSDDDEDEDEDEDDHGGKTK